MPESTELVHIIAHAEGCCLKALNKASLAGKLDKAESFECPRCGSLYRTKRHGTMVMWEYDSQIQVIPCQ